MVLAYEPAVVDPGMVYGMPSSALAERACGRDLIRFVRVGVQSGIKEPVFFFFCSAN